MGRQTKLTFELINQAKKLISAGNHTKTVCEYLGIGESTWYRWLDKGREHKGDLCEQLLKAVKSADATAEMRAVTGIMAAGKNNWQALAWFLERKYPDRWGKKKHEEEGIENINKLARVVGGVVKTRSR